MEYMIAVVPFNLVNWLSVSFYEQQKELQETINSHTMNRDTYLAYSSIKLSYLGYHFLSIILRTCKQFEVALKWYSNLKQLANELAHINLTMGKNEFEVEAPLNVTLNCSFKRQLLHGPKQ